MGELTFGTIDLVLRSVKNDRNRLASFVSSCPSVLPMYVSSKLQVNPYMQREIDTSDFRKFIGGNNIAQLYALTHDSASLQVGRSKQEEENPEISKRYFSAA